MCTDNEERQHQQKYFCERFEPGRHFKSKLNLIVRMNVALNRTYAVASD